MASFLRYVGLTKHTSMHHYRITFVKNEIATCVKTTEVPLLKEKQYHIEQNKGQLVFALVKATSKQQAISTTKKLVDEHIHK